MLTAVFYRLRLLLEKLSLRERYLLLVIVSAAIVGLAQLGLIVTGLDNNDAIHQDIERLKQESSRYQEALTSLQAAAANPRIVNLVASNNALQANIADLDERIEQIAQSLMTPTQMVDLVQRLLDQQENLTLLSFNVLPAVKLDTSGNDETAFYQHSLVLDLSGQYEALTHYLQRIENSTDKRLFWHSLQISTDQFPTLTIRLQVHTLSRQKEWLNV